MSAQGIIAEPLTADAFRPFGDVIEAAGDADMMINGGRCERFHNLARLSYDGGTAGVSLFRTRAVDVPCTVALMERHPLGSQTFMPMSAAPFLVVVAPDDAGKPGQPRAFLTRPHQGVSYLENVWHAPLLALEDGAIFTVIDRIGGGKNLEEYTLPAPLTVITG
jgi:ureidoglycolate lyase